MPMICAHAAPVAPRRSFSAANATIALHGETLLYGNGPELFATGDAHAKDCRVGHRAPALCHRAPALCHRPPTIAVPERRRRKFTRCSCDKSCC